MADPIPYRLRRRAHPQLARALAGLFGSVVLGGCATTAPLPELPSALPAQWQHATPGDAASAPLAHWWRAFGDARLDALVERALRDNLALGETAARLTAARALRRQAEASYRPTLAFGTTSTPAPDGNTSYFQAGFDASWEFGLFGRAEANTRIAAGEIGLAESDLALARVSVAAEVVRAWIEWRSALAQLDMLERARAVEQRRVTLTAVRERNALASALDLAQAQARLAVADAALTEPRAAIAAQRQQVAVLLGTTEAGSIPVPDATETATDLDIDSVPADLLRTRPQIRHTEQAVLKAAGELGIARADLYPRLGLGGALTFSTALDGPDSGGTHSAVSFGPGISIPLFDWGARRAVANAREAALAASVLAYRQAVLEGAAEVETALATLEQRRQRSEAARRGEDALRRARDASARLRELDLADGLDEAAADAALAQAEIERLQATQAHALAYVALCKALGGAPLPAETP